MSLRLHEIHPSVVHFPLALVPASLLLDLVGKVSGNQTLMNTARALMPVAAASGVVAGVAGLIAQESVRAEGEAHDTLVTHRNLNIALLAVVAGMTGVRMARRKPGWGYLAAGLGGVLAMNYTAYLGGKLPYAHGVGVEASGGVKPESVEMHRGTYGRATREAVRSLGRGLRNVVRELTRGEVAPLLQGHHTGMSPRSTNAHSPQHLHS